jgi:hypothetical protein
MDQRLLMLTRFWLRVAGIALLSWCIFSIREYLVDYVTTAFAGSWQYWSNMWPRVWRFNPRDPWTYTKLWWIGCLVGSVYLTGWNAGAARLLWRGLWASAGKCLMCGYDRSGLAPGKACPECGAT